MTMTTIILYAIAAYLIGSIPTGLLIGKYIYHKDLREYGSKNIGSTNAYRVLGKLPAFFVFLGDVLKGVIGVALFIPHTELMLLGGVLAIVGHNWPIFLGFKGGKGVATGLGVIVTLAPDISLIAIAIWLVIVLISKYVSLGSILAAISVPISMYVLDKPVSYIIFGILTAVFVVYRHKANIIRLYHGEELKVKRINTK